jgi:hypothetical protein
VFAIFSAPKAKKKRTQKLGIAPVEKLSVPLYVFVPDRELDFLTGSHVKLDADCMDTDCIDTDCIPTDCIDTDSMYANCVITDCSNANLHTCELHVNRLYNTNLYCSNSHNMNLYRVTDSHVKLIMMIRKNV